MATKKKPATWTDAEKDLAEKVIKQAREYTGTFIEKFGRAAKAYGYGSYRELPDGTKAYISSLGGKRRGKKATPKKESGTLLARTLKEHLPARVSELKRTDRPPVLPD